MSVLEPEAADRMLEDWLHALAVVSPSGQWPGDGNAYYAAAYAWAGPDWLAFLLPDAYSEAIPGPALGHSERGPLELVVEGVIFCRGDPGSLYLIDWRQLEPSSDERRVLEVFHRRFDEAQHRFERATQRPHL